VAEAYARGDNLLRSLSRVAGDAAAVDQIMRQWVAESGVPAVGLVALAAIRTVFVDCLYPTSEPSGALGFDQPEEDDTE